MVPTSWWIKGAGSAVALPGHTHSEFRPTDRVPGAIAILACSMSAVAPPSAPDGRPADRMAIRRENARDWQRTARKVRHAGLPVLHLSESWHALVAVALSRHDVPGIYLTQKPAN